ncbi:MAG: hypothetical protein WKI04_12810 [Ferruginibacter sp.]
MKTGTTGLNPADQKLQALILKIKNEKDEDEDYYFVQPAFWRIFYKCTKQEVYLATGH